MVANTDGGTSGGVRRDCAATCRRMSGWYPYVWDPDGEFAKNANMAMVTLEPVLARAEQEAKVDRSIA